MQSMEQYCKEPRVHPWRVVYNFPYVTTKMKKEKRKKQAHIKSIEKGTGLCVHDSTVNFISKKLVVTSHTTFRMHLSNERILGHGEKLS